VKEPVDVEPEEYDAASKVFGDKIHSALNNASGRLESALGGSGAMAGSDPAGVSWASSYDDAARDTHSVLVDLETACLKVAQMLQKTGFNHGMADSASDPSKSVPTPPDRSSYVPSKRTVPDLPSAKGGSASPPAGWWLIEHTVGYVWPNGHPDKLRAAAHAWSACADSLNATTAYLPEAVEGILDQQSPEVSDAFTVCNSMSDHIEDIGSSCKDVSKACSDFADGIDKAHQDVVDELTSLLEWTIGIEAGGALLGAVTLGIGEGGAQGAEAARVAVTASRVGKIIQTLIDLVGTLTRAVSTVFGKIGKVAQRLLRIERAEVNEATVTAAGKTPALAEDTETAAFDGITKDAAAHAAGTVPQGLTEEQYIAAAQALRSGAGHYGGEIVVQGSRAAGTAGPASDIDFAIRVSPERFKQLVAERFGTPNPGSAKLRTMEHAIKTGKIQAGEAGLSGLRRSLEKELGMDVDISIVQSGGPFDTPPFIGVP
jgi:nucleotidyltransferase-like protein